MYEIREYDIKDKEELIKLWLDVCVKEHGFEEWEEGMSILDDKEYEKILVATHNNNIIGSMAYKKIDNDMVELKRFYIYPEYRGNGISKKLYKAIIDIIKENKYKKVLVETWEKFERGIAFYYKNNFELKSKEEDKYTFLLELE